MHGEWFGMGKGRDPSHHPKGDLFSPDSKNSLPSKKKSFYILKVVTKPKLLVTNPVEEENAVDPLR
jgi:hypothetical protein